MKYNVLIVPSSDDERNYENCATYTEALEIHELKGDCSVKYSFNTEIERDAFIKGYHSAIGYLGNGIFFTP